MKHDDNKKLTKMTEKYAGIQIENPKYIFMRFTYSRTEWIKKPWYTRLRYWLYFYVILPESKIEIIEDKKETT